jgi:hypothetical protein
MPDCNQCSETNLMYVLFNLLRIKCLYVFRALLTHPQEVKHKRHLVYRVRVMSVITRTQYTKCYCVAPPEDKPRRGP